MHKFILMNSVKARQFYIGLLSICTLFTHTVLRADQIDTTWWYNQYLNGLKYLNNNDLESAKNEFNLILNKDKTIAHGYYGLGLVYDKLAKDTVIAIENLEKAIELNPDFIEAYYYLGLLYEHQKSGSSAKKCFETIIEKDPQHTDAWIALARAEEKFRMPWDLPFDEKPLEILKKALEFNPGDITIYDMFKNYAFWYSYESMSIPIIQSMIEIYPSNSTYAFDYASALYTLDEYDSCMKLMDSIEVRYPVYSEFEINLMRSKILFNTDRTEEGFAFYWQAINSIKSSTDSHLMFADLRYIMINSEFDDYQATPLKELPNFYSRFWRSRDPNLATKINERIPEHYKRLKQARKNFRRYESGYYNKVVIYQFDHPLNGILNIKLGDELIDPYASKAISDKRDIDDRGLIYLRHGEPDNFAFSSCRECPLNLSWKYFATHNHPELIFHFSKHSDIRGWYLESLPYTFRERGDFGGWYALLDPTQSLNIDFYRDMPRYIELNEQSIENVKVGLKTETTEYKFPKTLIDFPLDYLCFKGKDSKTEVYLFYGIEGEHLQIDESNPKNRLLYSTFVGLFDDQWNEVLRQNMDYIVPLEVTADQWEENSFIELERFSLYPGNYHGEFQIRDKISDHMGVYKGKISVPDYRKNDLLLSDILLSGPVSKKSDREIFTKGDLAFSPHMFNGFSEDATIGIYVEVYNLVYDVDDRTKFEITWSLKEAEEEEDESDMIKSSLQYSGQSRDDKIYFNLELADTDSGNYEMIISVKDLNSQSEASKKVKLIVL